MTYTITDVLDIGGDVLLVRATNDDGDTVEATGHVSATTNHYDDDQYADYGERDIAKKTLPIGSTGRHLKPTAQPRSMTPAEVGTYAQRLLAEQCAPVAVQPEPVSIAFE